MYGEDDFLPISALQHLAYCERQWALIHLEGLWAENALTAQGGTLHRKVHETDTEVRGDIRIARGLRLRSARLGLTGRADVVEFHRLPANSSRGAQLQGADGLWQPFPVEYKRGRSKEGVCDEVQLCAQAMCLEEMLDVPIPRGALYYGQPRRRTDVELDRRLRDKTVALVERLRRLTEAAQTPPPTPGKNCRRCSLRSQCLPRTVLRAKASCYTRRMMADIEESAP